MKHFLQHFVLLALSPLLATPPSFPTGILRGFIQLYAVCQSVSVIISQIRKTNYRPFFCHFHAHQPNIYVPVKYIFTLFLMKPLHFSALQLEKNMSAIPATSVKLNQLWLLHELAVHFTLHIALISQLLLPHKHLIYNFVIRWIFTRSLLFPLSQHMKCTQTSVPN